jgi:hypothetical protein
MMVETMAYQGRYNFKLTEHLWLYEFIVSADYPELAKKVRLTKFDGIKAQYLAATILEPARMRFGAELLISSGKCSKELNAAIGRDEDTEHTWAGPSCVTDFVISGVASVVVYNWIKSKLPHAYGQLIYYTDKHIHVGLPTHQHHGEAWIV